MRDVYRYTCKKYIHIERERADGQQAREIEREKER